MTWLQQTRLLVLPLRVLFGQPLLPRGSRRAYLVAASIVALGTALRLLLTPWLAGAQFITFFPSVIAATVLCGAGAGFFAVALSILAAWYFILPAMFDLQQLASLLLFAAIAVTDVLIIAALQAAVAQVQRLNASLRDSEGRFRGLLETAPDAMVIVDPKGRITLVNAQTESLFGYRRDEMVGQEEEMLLPERLRGPHAAWRDRFMKHPEARRMGAERELRGLRKDGTEFPLEASLSPLQSTEGLLVSAAIRDITAQKRATAELEEARRVEAAASRAKSDFLASMSHELRTPLNAVIGFAQMLEIDRSQRLTPRQKEYIGYILSGGHHLLSLVNEVLDLAGIESGRLHMSIERVSVHDAIESVRGSMSPLAQKARLIFEVINPAGIGDVYADDLRLRQILINLLSNAIKYNRPGGTLRLTAKEMPGGAIRFVVSDTGIGIAPGLQKDMFEPFQRLGANHTAIEGTGIGLALSRRIVQAMNGTIGFTSEPGVGSEFWIELPGASADAAEATSMPSSSAPPHAMLGGFSLLYVEDNPSNLRLMERLVSTLPNVALEMAATPQLGLDMAAAHRPDVIVLDLNLPGISGYEVLARLQAAPETRGIPVLALTAAAFPRDVKKGLDAGFFRYLTKPLDVGAFLAAVNDALAAAPAQRAERS